MAATEHDVVRSELRWTAVVSGFVVVTMALTLFAALALQRNPPSNLERIDPKTLHLLGRVHRAQSRHPGRGATGRSPTRIVATQFAFVPRCVVVPEDQEVTLRLASPDVIHGILVTGTNVNTMVVPGYVSQVHTRVSHDRRPADAVPRVLRPRAQPDAGARARRSARPVPSRCAGEGELWSAIEAWCWRIAGSPSACSRLAALLGVWQMWVRSPLHAPYADPETTSCR